MNTTTITKKDGEFRVRLFIDGAHQAGADYFTNDKKDAEATAKAMRENGVKSDKSSAVASEEAADRFSTMYHVCNDMTLEEGDPDITGASSSVVNPDGVYYYALGELFAIKSHAGRDGEEL